MLGSHAAQPFHHAGHLAAQYPQQAVLGKGFLMFFVSVKHLGRATTRSRNVDDVQNIDDLVALVSFPKLVDEFLQQAISRPPLTGQSIHQPNHRLSRPMTGGHLLGQPSPGQASTEIGVSPGSA